MHISLHELGDDVDVFEPCLRGGFRDVQNLDDVFVIEELQELDFPDDTLRIDQVFKGLLDFLDRDFDLVLVVISAANDAISSMANLFDVFKLVLDNERRA